MSGITSYILTVTAAAMLAAIIRELAGNGAMGALVKFLSGLFVALAVLSPLVKLELPDVTQWLSEYQYDGQAAAAAGENMAEEAERELIKQRLESYIMDKAAAYSTVLDADVALDAGGVPVSVTLRGDLPPGVKAKLQRMLQTDLGLEEEAQHWME